MGGWDWSYFAAMFVAIAGLVLTAHAQRRAIRAGASRRYRVTFPRVLAISFWGLGAVAVALFLSHLDGFVVAQAALR